MTFQWLRGGIVVLGVFLAAISARAQDDDEIPPLPPWVVHVQDDVYLGRVVGSDTLPAGWFSAAYQFDMNYDSQCVVSYDFTECKLNGVRLYLPKWKDNRVVNAPPDILSFNSTTDTFTCRTGDSLAFYREISWVDPRTRWQTIRNFYSLDTLDYTVELIRLSDSSRVAVLDSFGVMPSPQLGTPQFHGMRPLLAMVEYVIPPELEGEKVFLRILLYHRGEGAYWFTRNDQVMVNWSARRFEPGLQKYMSLFGNGAPKYPVATLETERSEATLNVESMAGGSDVTITFDTSPRGGATSLGIYNLQGERIYMPYSSGDNTPGLRQIRYHFERPGVYFVALLHGGSIVRSRKITISY